MGTKTTIEWCHHTFNPWWGCTNISPGCDNCYAESWAKRFGVKWGVGETRRLASERTWAEPLKWNEKAKKDGTRRRVFCASMADVFDNEHGLEASREWLWEMIEDTINLDWLLLTKRIGNVMHMVPDRWQTKFPPHIWMGSTVVNQEEADRDIPKLLRVPAAVRFLSCEPLLGHIALMQADEGVLRGPAIIEAGGMTVGTAYEPPEGYDCSYPGIDWVIAGAEHSRQARPMSLDWVRSLRDQCELAGVSFFYKQDFRDGIKSSTPLLDGKRWVEVPNVD